MTSVLTAPTTHGCSSSITCARPVSWAAPADACGRRYRLCCPTPRWLLGWSSRPSARCRLRCWPPGQRVCILCVLVSFPSSRCSLPLGPLVMWTRRRQQPSQPPPGASSGWWSCWAVASAVVVPVLLAVTVAVVGVTGATEVQVEMGLSPPLADCGCSACRTTPFPGCSPSYTTGRGGWRWLVRLASQATPSTGCSAAYVIPMVGGQCWQASPRCACQGGTLSAPPVVSAQISTCKRWCGERRLAGGVAATAAVAGVLVDPLRCVDLS